jgi:hypothetical protein
MNIAGSCNCNSCPKDFKSVQPEFMNNLGVPNCQYPESFDCVDRIKWAEKINPALSNYGRYDQSINPNFGLVSAPEFYEVDCQGSKAYTANFDARLSDPVRGTISMSLDRAPYQARDKGTYDNPQIYTKEYDQISPKIYGDYSTINNGQIRYYHDKTMDDPYFSPNFVRRYNVDYVLFKDPMGAIKPEYIRKPLNYTDRNFSKDSFIRDSTQFREDIMERQMRVRNQQRYEPRYFSAN